MDFAVLVDHRIKKKKKKEMRDKYLDHARELKKGMEHEDESDTNCNSWYQDDLRRIDKGTGSVGIRRREEISS